MGYYGAASVNLSTKTSKGAFTEATPLPAHLVKVFSELRARGFPQAFDVWDEMKNEMPFNKQTQLSEVFTEQKGTNTKCSAVKGESAEGFRSNG